MDNQATEKGLSTSKLVENFVDQYRKPFSLDILCEMISRTRKQVRPVITRMMFKDRIMEIEPGIYVAVRRERIILSRMNGNMLWNYNAEVGNQVMGILKSHKISNVRALAKLMGVSRQYAYLYLEALASIGAVGWNDGRYVSQKVDSEKVLGSQVEKGILGRLRWGICDGSRNKGQGHNPNMREAHRG